jgi:ABC-type transport system involved in multi-copper enzyme maturation permease subunit
MSSIPNTKNIFAKNAVLFKDMSIDIKRPKIMILMLIFNVILFTIAGGFLIYIASQGMRGNAIDYRTLATMLIVLICVEAGILFLVTPALTGNSISGERERQTLDVLLTTRMTPFEIIMGKFLSSAIQSALLVLSSFPILALVFIYGGMNFFQLLGLVAVLIFEVAYISVFGIFFSASLKRTAPSIVLSYVVLGFLLFGTLTITFLIYALVESSYLFRTLSTQAQANQLHIDWIFLFLYINPGVTIFDCIGLFIGVDPGDVAFKGMRSVLDLNYITSENFLVTFWTPISMVIQGAIMFGLLKLSAHNLSPVKNTKRRERAYQMNNMKNIGVQQEVPLGGPVPPTPAAQADAQAPAQPQMEAQPQAPVQPQMQVPPQMPPQTNAPVPPTPAANINQGQPPMGQM